MCARVFAVSVAAGGYLLTLPEALGSQSPERDWPGELPTRPRLKKIARLDRGCSGISYQFLKLPNSQWCFVHCVKIPINPKPYNPEPQTQQASLPRISLMSHRKQGATSILPKPPICALIMSVGFWGSLIPTKWYNMTRAQGVGIYDSL